jgi:hypothetical protein
MLMCMWLCLKKIRSMSYYGVKLITNIQIERMCVCACVITNIQRTTGTTTGYSYVCVYESLKI